ncbi:MAG: putative transport system permease protein [Ilumatobacteraceae bacterium]
MFAIAVGVVAAAAISLVAGALRSSSVVDRFFASAPRYDLSVFSQSSELRPEVASALPGVVRADPSPYIAFVSRGLDGRNLLINSTTLDVTQADPTVRLLRGRLPGDDSFEVVVNEAVVSQFGLDVGDRIPVATFAQDQFDELRRGVYTPRGPHYDFSIVGIVRTPDDIAIDEARSPRPGATTSKNSMMVPVEFWTAHRSQFIDFGSSFNVRLADGPAGIDSFLAAVKKFAAGGNVLSDPWNESARKAAFKSPVDLETAALMSVGVGAAIGALGLILLLLRLDHYGLEQENNVLRSMGLTSAGLSRIAVLRTLPSALTAAVIAVVVSVVMSARFPVGLGRQLELHTGVEVNFAIVATGAVLTAMLPLLVSALLAWRSNRVRASDGMRPPSRILSSSRLPLHPMLGTRLAFGGNTRRRRASSVVGMGASVVAIAAAIAVSMWIIGTQRLYDEPSSRGWAWDVAIGNVNFAMDSATAQAIKDSPFVNRATAVSYGQATLNGRSTEVLAFDLAGTAPPEIARGRLPASPSEAALGAGLMRSLHLDLGSTVTLSLDGSEFTDENTTQTTPVKMTVVGESISPVFGESDVADVGLVSLDAIGMAGGDPSPRIVLADVVGSDRAASVRQLIARHSEEVHTDVIPARIVNLRRVRAVPLAGIALAAAIGVVALIATVFAAGRSNRRMLVVLSALGLERSGTRRALGWQGLLVAACVLVLALPVGLMTDVTWWRRVRYDLGVTAGVPIVVPVLVASAAILVTAGVVAAFGAAVATRRTTVAAALRTDDE